MANRLLALARLPGRAAALAASGADRLQQLLSLTKRSLKTSEDAVKRASALDRRVKDTRAELRALREEVQARLLQYNLQLGRAIRQLEQAILARPGLD